MIFFLFFFNDTATTEIYTLSLHDALPISWALDAMLLADVAWLLAVWLDARRATPPQGRDLTVQREAPLAFSVGRIGEVSYRWSNAVRRRARLRLREVRPDLLGGLQPPREILVP